jgi:hypothetical protein
MPPGHSDPFRAYRDHDGLETGRTRHNRRQALWTVTRGVIAAVAVTCCIGVAALAMYQRDMAQLIRRLRLAMDERSSICLSSFHVGVVDTFAVSVRLSDVEDEVLLNPSLFQSFGREVLTQEIAHRPTHCSFGSSASYQIGRVRRESITVSYVPVDLSDLMWPMRSIMPQAARLRTYTGAEALCIQHCLEVLAQRAPCVALAPSLDTVQRDTEGNDRGRLEEL